MSSTFTVFPMKQEMNLEAGKTYQGMINIANPADAEDDFSYIVEILPFSVQGEDYNVDLATKSTWSQMVEWVTIDEPTGKIKPNEVKQVTFKIKVPTDAPAGGQYVALGVRSAGIETTENGLNLQNVYEMDSVILANIAGDTVHNGDVVSNTLPGFVTSGHAVASAMLTNSGNVHEIAEVVIQVKNAITSEIVFPREDTVNVYEELIMPGTSRYVTREVNDLPELGIFEVTQSITYMGETSLNTTTLVMCPVWFLILMILTVGVLIGTIMALLARRKRKKNLKKAL